MGEGPVTLWQLLFQTKATQHLPPDGARVVPPHRFVDMADLVRRPQIVTSFVDPSYIDMGSYMRARLSAWQQAAVLHPEVCTPALRDRCVRWDIMKAQMTHGVVSPGDGVVTDEERGSVVTAALTMAVPPHSKPTPDLVDARLRAIAHAEVRKELQKLWLQLVERGGVSRAAYFAIARMLYEVLFPHLGPAELHQLASTEIELDFPEAGIALTSGLRSPGQGSSPRTATPESRGPTPASVSGRRKTNRAVSIVEEKGQRRERRGLSRTRSRLRSRDSRTPDDAAAAANAAMRSATGPRLSQVQFFRWATTLLVGWMETHAVAEALSMLRDMQHLLSRPVECFDTAFHEKGPALRPDYSLLVPTLPARAVETKVALMRYAKEAVAEAVVFRFGVKSTDPSARAAAAKKGHRRMTSISAGLGLDDGAAPAVIPPMAEATRCGDVDMSEEASGLAEEEEDHSSPPRPRHGFGSFLLGETTHHEPPHYTGPLMAHSARCSTVGLNASTTDDVVHRREPRRLSGDALFDASMGGAEVAAAVAVSGSATLPPVFTDLYRDRRVGGNETSTSGSPAAQVLTQSGETSGAGTTTRHSTEGHVTFDGGSAALAVSSDEEHRAASPGRMALLRSVGSDGRSADTRRRSTSQSPHDGALESTASLRRKPSTVMILNVANDEHGREVRVLETSASGKRRPSESVHTTTNTDALISRISPPADPPIDAVPHPATSSAGDRTALPAASASHDRVMAGSHFLSATFRGGRSASTADAPKPPTRERSPVVSARRHHNPAGLDTRRFDGGGSGSGATDSPRPKDQRSATEILRPGAAPTAAPPSQGGSRRPTADGTASSPRKEKVSPRAGALGRSPQSLQTALRAAEQREEEADRRSAVAALATLFHKTAGGKIIVPKFRSRLRSDRDPLAGSGAAPMAAAALANMERTTALAADIHPPSKRSSKVPRRRHTVAEGGPSTHTDAGPEKERVGISAAAARLARPSTDPRSEARRRYRDVNRGLGGAQGGRRSSNAVQSLPPLPPKAATPAPTTTNKEHTSPAGAGPSSGFRPFSLPVGSAPTAAALASAAHRATMERQLEAMRAAEDTRLALMARDAAVRAARADAQRMELESAGGAGQDLGAGDVFDTTVGSAEAPALRATMRTVDRSDWRLDHAAAAMRRLPTPSDAVVRFPALRGSSTTLRQRL